MTRWRFRAQQVLWAIFSCKTVLTREKINIGSNEGVKIHHSNQRMAISRGFKAFYPEAKGLKSAESRKM